MIRGPTQGTTDTKHSMAYLSETFSHTMHDRADATGGGTSDTGTDSA